MAGNSSDDDGKSKGIGSWGRARRHFGGFFTSENSGSRRSVTGSDCSTRR